MDQNNLFRNLFAKGLDLDTDIKLSSNETYRGASHVRLTGDGSLMGLQALKGTTKITTMLAGPLTFTNINIMAAVRVRCYFVSAGVIDDGIVIFWGRSSSGVYSFNISVFRPSTGSINFIYSESVGADVMRGAVDAVVVRDGMVDTVYFTNGLSYPRKLKCIIPSSQLIDRNLDLFRRYPQSGISVDQILYNPKEQSFLTALHRLRLVSTLSNNQPNQQTEYASLLFETVNGSSSIGIANTFRVTVNVNVQQSIENDGSSSFCTVEGGVYNRNGTLVQGVNNTISSAPVGGQLYTTFSQNFNVSVDVPTGVSDYDVNPLKVRTMVSTSGSADMFTQVSLSLQSIVPLGADTDNYVLGTNTSIFLYLPVD